MKQEQKAASAKALGSGVLADLNISKEADGAIAE